MRNMVLLLFASIPLTDCFYSIHGQKIVRSLECFSCQENVVDLFGECASQTRIVCDTVNLEKDEHIFCRTASKKEKNNTYTLTRECVTEREHLKTFPKTEYLLEDECNFFEVNGSVTSYCLCRRNGCNQKSLVEQFKNFERLHPWMYADVVEATTETVPESVETERKLSDRHCEIAMLQNHQAELYNAFLRRDCPNISPTEEQEVTQAVARTIAILHSNQLEFLNMTTEDGRACMNSILDDFGEVMWNFDWYDTACCCGHSSYLYFLPPFSKVMNRAHSYYKKAE